MNNTSYEIRIKGHSEPLTVSYEVWQQVKNEWERYLQTRHDSAVTIDSWTGRLSNIRDFSTSRGSRANDNARVEIAEQEYKRELYRLRSLTPEARARNLDFFDFLVFTYTGKKATAEQREKAIEIQERFFTERPKRTVCDATLFERLIPRDDYRSEPEQVGTVQTTSRLAVESGLSLVEEAVRQDVYAEKHL